MELFILLLLITFFFCGYFHCFFPGSFHFLASAFVDFFSGRAFISAMAAVSLAFRGVMGGLMSELFGLFRS